MNTKREEREKLAWVYSMAPILHDSILRRDMGRMGWKWLSIRQPLREDFIREFADQLIWRWVSECQSLSENLIREFADRVDWNEISKYQKLSEDFIREFQERVNWNEISKYQKLSEDFIREFNLTVPPDNWNYLSDVDKRKIIEDAELHYWEIPQGHTPKYGWDGAVRKTYKYDWDKDYLLGYKAVSVAGYSLFNGRYVYEPGQTYESHCDCNPENKNSFGLGINTPNGAQIYGKFYHTPFKILKVRTHVSDIGFFDTPCGWIRCSKLTVIGEV